MTDPARAVLTAILDTTDAMETKGLRSPGEKLLHRTLRGIADRAITTLESEEKKNGQTENQADAL